MPPFTPPSSPSVNESIDDEVLEEDIVEVIDLDESDDGDDTNLDDLEADQMSFDDETEGLNLQAAEGGSLQTKIVEVNSDVVFSRHEKSVFTCDISPNIDIPLAVSGGEDDRAFIWDWRTGKFISELGTSQEASPSNFKDSVVFVRFNKDGSLVAAADMSGIVKVWRIPKLSRLSTDGISTDCQWTNNIKTEPLWTFETSDISWLCWHIGAQNVLFAGTEASELWMWKVPSGDSKVYMGRGEKVETAIIMPDGKRISVAYGDGTIKIFDLKSGEVLSNFTHYDKIPNAPDTETSTLSMPVSTLDVSGGHVLASGGVNGVVKMYNTQTGKAIGTLVCSASNSKEVEENGMPKTTTVEAVLFSNVDQNIVVTGTLDGIVTIWDVSSQVSRHSVNVGEGVVKMLWRNGKKADTSTSTQPNGSTITTSSSQIFVATLDGIIKILDIRSGEILGECSGHTAGILDISQSTDGKTIVSCSDDGDCRVFDVEKVLDIMESDDKE